MAERLWVKAKRVVENMNGSSWFDPNAKKKAHRDGRTINEMCFDSGVFAASEVIRRLTGDEELALAIHEASIWRQREHAAGTSKTY